MVLGSMVELAVEVEVVCAAVKLASRATTTVDWKSIFVDFGGMV